MISIRKSETRGRSNLAWLDSRHTFSFSEYHDPAHMGFRALRVINDDLIAGAGGFPTHPHRNMEIVSYVAEGALQHQDSMGNGSVIRPGDMQRMTAGTGVFHSEYNASRTERVRLLQIWLLPERSGLPPGYEQKQFPASERQGRLLLVGSRDGRNGSVTIHQDVNLYAGLLGGGDQVDLPLAMGRHVWIQLVSGSIAVNGVSMAAGDGAALSAESVVKITGKLAAELLVFDLA